MKTKKLGILAIFIISFIVLLLSKAFAGGPITHMTIKDDVINHPDLDPKVKKILQENPTYARAGAVGPDLFYYTGEYGAYDKRFADLAHYCSPAGLARMFLALAKNDQERAFAYAWMTHVASDRNLHQWVNSLAGGEYDPKNQSIKIRHQYIEMCIDKNNLMKYGTNSGDTILNCISRIINIFKFRGQNT